MHTACHECDLLVDIPDLAEGSKAVCPRCDYVITARHRNSQDRVIAYAISALIFLSLSFIFPFLTFSAQGQDRTVTLVESITVLANENFISLSIIIFSVIIVIPALYLLSAIYIYLSFKLKKLLPYTVTQLKLIGHLQHWSMAEIFLIGILVSFVKIASLAEVSLGLSFWSYVIFIVFMMATILHIDQYQAWRWVIELSPKKSQKTGDETKLESCDICLSLSAASASRCAVCGSKLHHRIDNSLQKTWAFLITSIILYIPANLLPVMHTIYLGEETANTILGGVLVLWQHGSYPIAIIIFIASVLVPVIKIVILSWLCYSIQTRSLRSFKQKTRLYRFTELIGRWSMVDVFVVAILVALIKLGNIMSIYPGWGAVAFAAMVVASVLAAMSFDPRLIWDNTNQENYHE